eukprot:g7320.t1
MSFVQGLRQKADTAWFPFFVASLSAINLFTLVLSAPTAACFVWGVLARPSRWFKMAVINAAGTVLGAAALVYVFVQYGQESFQAKFPQLTDPKWGARFEAWHGNHGTAGIVAFSAMPIILHPIIFFGLVAKIEHATLLGAIFAGRVVKYSIMGYCTHHAPTALRFFGIDFDKVTADGKGKGKGKGKVAAEGAPYRPRVYQLAALQWGILAPLNLVKVLLNKVSPTARMWVPEASETCQKNCAIARMWATLFWSLQCCLAVAYFHVYHHPEQTGLIKLGIGAKLCVGALLLKGFAEGVVKAPIGAAGALDWLMAAAFAWELASRKVQPKKKSS